MEKPITTTRNAVKGMAEEFATKEYLAKPEQRHFDLALERLKMLRGLNPELLKKVIILTSEAKELKDALGPLHVTFDQVWDELSGANFGSIVAGINQLQQSKLSNEELDQEISSMLIRASKELAQKIVNDKRIISAFENKSELLEKVKVFVETKTPDIINIALTAN